MDSSFLSLIPPLVVLIVAILFRIMNTAFLAGICSAALISCSGSLSQSLSLMIARLYETVTSLDNLYLYSFLILIGTLIITFNAADDITALAHYAKRRLKSKKQAETASIIFSFFMFIDDYLSILTVGHIIKPLVERFGIPRVKLAYLVHSLAGVVVILAPISSWVATITAQLHQAGISSEGGKATLIIADPFFVYLHTLPFILYSLLTIASVIFIVRKKISFGAMYTYEKKEHTFHTPTTLTSDRKSILPIIMPIISLVMTMTIGLLYSGNFWLFGGNRTLFEAIQHNNNPFFIMFIAGSIALIMSLTINLAKQKISCYLIPSLFVKGFKLMSGALGMIFLSATLGTMLKADLSTGTYLADTMLNTVPIPLLPALFFIVSLVCAIATGSAWGTFSLMLSIAIPMLVSLSYGTPPLDPHSVVLLFPALGALFSGAVCGDHISPISETTIMAASSSGTTPLNHAKTQFPYALPALCWTFLGFIIAGYSYTWGSKISIVLSLGIPLLGCITTLVLLDRKNHC